MIAWIFLGFCSAIWIEVQIVRLRIRLWWLMRPRYANGLRPWRLPQRRGARIQATIRDLRYYGHL
jgi:hypothetical protein